MILPYKPNFVLSGVFLAGIFAISAQPGLFAQTAAEKDVRHRARELGIVVGKIPTGRWNAITDVAGVLVGQTTIIRGSGPLRPGEGPVRTGVTAVFPRRDIWSNGVFAATHTFNGDGEMTGTHWIRDLETLNYPVMLTNTGSVGGVMDAVSQYTTAKHPEHRWDFLPIVAETFDGSLNDIHGRHVHYDDVAAALDSAKDGPVEEGNAGGGTGMVCFGFKCGIGTSSRQLPESQGGYKVGVLVQANFGSREQLRVNGVPVGAEIPDRVPTTPSPVKPNEAKPDAPKPDQKEGSIIIVLATDAPLSSRQLERVAQRTAIGMARTGGTSGNSSGDIFIAFSTANVIPLRGSDKELSIRLLTTERIDPIFRAAVEATEEAILNALTMGKTMEGVNGHVAYQLPYDRLAAIMAKYGRPLTPAAH
jgi:D-aminopeptidase